MSKVQPQKPLSDKQAQACENAVGPVCRCRCGGALHGRKGGGTMPDGGIDRAYFERLPDDDPHRLLTTEEQAAQRRAREEERKERKRLEREELHNKRYEAWKKLSSRIESSDIYS